jgi:hypothetical protein
MRHRVLHCSRAGTSAHSANRRDYRRLSEGDPTAPAVVRCPPASLRLGHLAGLNHTSDPSQIIYPYAGGPTNASDYGSGERNVHREVGGSGGCVVVPTPNWQASAGRFR